MVYTAQAETRHTIAEGGGPTKAGGGQRRVAEACVTSNLLGLGIRNEDVISDCPWTLFRPDGQVGH